MLQGWWWWKWVVEVMSGGGRCLEGKKSAAPEAMIMGEGVEGDVGRCGTENEEKPCPNDILPISSLAPGNDEITETPQKFSNITNSPQLENFNGMDLYTQAFKALSYRSPFDDASGQPSSSSSAAANVVVVVPPSSTTTSSTLPSGLAQLLTRHSDSRKRHKKAHSGSEYKSSSRTEKGRGSNIWVETEEYFRELTVEDIERLHQVSIFGFSGNEEYFVIPKLSNVEGKKDDKGIENNVVNDVVNCVNLNGVEVKEEEIVKEENGQQYMDVDSVEGGGKDGNQVVQEENVEVKGEENRDGEKGKKEEKNERGSCAFSGVEWLLGSRSKIYLTSERPSKKRKLLGGDAGLEKLLVACPVEGSASLCHYCSLGDTGDQLNRLIVCGSCGVAVHQRCYGVQEDVHDSWYCSWCKRKQKIEVQPHVERRCLLCPKQSGALKPTRKRGSESDNGGSMEFAHLFCCQWMPEVYVENTRTMEPIVNIDGIKETRKKLVCYLCKDKCGACVRCSNGACRTSFHPICAREARQRMEIWGKLGYDEVELRAFCSKHSEVQNSSSSHSGINAVPVGPDSLNAKNGPVVLTNKPPKLRIGLRNGDKMAVSVETADSQSDLDKFKDCVIHQEGLLENRSKVKFQTECGDTEHLVDKEASIRNRSEDINASESPNFTMILKMLVERGKVDMKDVAIDTGVSLDSLASMLTGNHVSSDMHCKIDKWLKNHAYLGSLQKPLKVKFKSSKAETDVADDPKALSVVESDIPDVVPVKSVPPRRRTKSNVRILHEDKVLTLSKEVTNDDGVGLDESRGCLSDGEEPNCLNRGPPVDSGKILTDRLNTQDIRANNSLKSEVDPPSAHGCFENGQAEIATMSEQNPLLKVDIGKCTHSVSVKDIPDLIKHEASSSSYIHPLIRKKLMEMETGVLLKSTSDECDGYRDREVSELPASSSSGICCNHSGHQSTSSNLVAQFTGANFDQLVNQRNMALLEFSPADEVEGELIYYQHRLICNAVARKRFTDDLISKVVKSLPQEIDAARKQKWDAVSLNQYLYELREAKKQGRKERRHKEAQAVLAAATAAAAASSRISSLRKDTPEDSAYQEDLAKVNAPNGKLGNYSPQNARAKETLSRASVARLSLEKTSDFFQLTSDNSRENPRTCDICRRSETMLNAILVCSSCKVAVHLDCYRGVNNSTGPWYCELCEDLLSARGSGAPAMNSWERPYFVPECGLCGGTAGAFRKSTDGQWIHAFCAEWVLESTFRRGQTKPVDGMETISKGNDSCIICRRKHGVCLKCHYGHCQSTFHPSCGRSAGFYMIVRTTGGKLQHKAYCEKHSLEQRVKAENQRHGIEELKSLKQVRVELERLRLLCERIIKREKLKRELVICSQHILASKRDSVVLSARSRHPLFQPDISSESVTTSVKAYPDGCKSGSEVMQRSDDITVDSTVAGKRHIEFPICMDNDQKTDDSSTSQHPLMQKPTERLSFAGKQIPHRPPSASSRSTSDDREKRSKLRMHTETFEKELVMTSDQASMKNQRLPKGYVYVPIRCLSKEKEAVPDACSGEPMERDG